MKLFSLIVILFLQFKGLAQVYPATPVEPAIEIPETKNSSTTTVKQSNPPFPVDVNSNNYQPMPATVSNADLNKVRNNKSFKENPSYNPSITPEENKKHFDSIDEKQTKDDLVMLGVILLSILFVIILGISIRDMIKKKNKSSTEQIY